MINKTVCELFAGVGGFRVGLGDTWETVWANQWEPGKKQQHAFNCYIKHFGDKPEYVNEDIGTIDKTTIPDHNLLVGGFPCLVKDTLVLTKDGYKQLIDIKPGDMVLSHDNEYHEVTKFMEQGVKPVVKITGSCFDNIKATENHKFFVRRKKFVWNNKLRKYDRMFENPEWLPVSELIKYDENGTPNYKNYYLGSAINQESIIPTWNGIDISINQFKTKHQNNLDLTDLNFWYIAGRYLGDGWLRKQYKNGNHRNKYSGFIICCGKNEKDNLIAKIPEKYKYTLSEENTVFRFIFCDIEFAEFLSQFGDGAKNKFLPGFIFDLPVDLLKSFVDGYLDADGCFVKNTSNRQFSSISKNLIYGIAQCIMKVYKVPCEITFCKTKNTKKIEGRTVNQNDFYMGRFKQDTNKYMHKFFENGYVWYPITNMGNLSEAEPVYDIEVKDSHSFVVNNCITHNCQDYSVAHTGATGIEGKKGVLWWDIRDTLIAKKPKFVLLENVDRLLKSPAKQRGRDFGVILACFNDLGYSVEWRVITASDYGFPQKRKRTFIFAYQNDTTYHNMIKDNSLEHVIHKSGFFYKYFPIENNTLGIQESFTYKDVFDVSDNFKFNFLNSGVMTNGVIYTEDVIPVIQSAKTLGEILETNVDDKYNAKDLDKWAYLKGNKRILRTTKEGFEYWYTEGAMAYPDYLDRPARTMLTSEGSLSRTSHILEDPETKNYRILTPMECERINGFPDNWTNTGMPERMRYFCMGNALVVGLITNMSKRLDEIFETEN